jgi:hypothetical protein
LRVILLTVFLASPLYLLDALVIPVLDELARTYAGFEQTAENIANGKQL